MERETQEKCDRESLRRGGEGVVAEAGRTQQHLVAEGHQGDAHRTEARSAEPDDHPLVQLPRELTVRLAMNHCPPWARSAGVMLIITAAGDQPAQYYHRA
jgi:hypothetical protein